jgi:hypothetical protein
MTINAPIPIIDERQGDERPPYHAWEAVSFNILVGLSWMGEVTTRHVGRIWTGHRSQRSGQDYMHRLKDAGLVKVRYQYSVKQNRAGRSVPRRQLAAWSLTDAGFAMVEEQDQTVENFVPPRHKILMEHDLFTSEVVTRVIELGRPLGLSGLMVYRENRIDPRRRKPIVDAVIVARYEPGMASDPLLVPWTKDPYMETEYRRRWALENDRGTEPLNVLAAKAEQYKQANTLEWRAANGFFPIPLVVTTSQGRMERIFDLWRRTWPDGGFLMTTDAGLQTDRWVLYNQGYVCERGLFGTPLPEPEVKAGSIFLEAARR